MPYLVNLCRLETFLFNVFEIGASLLGITLITCSDGGEEPKHTMENGNVLLTRM